MDPKQVLDTLPKGWVTKDEALKLTGRSLKRFEQAVAAANLDKQLLNNPGKRPTPIFRREDIEKLKKGTAQSVAVRRYPLITTSPITGMSVRQIEAQPAQAVSIDRLHLITQEQAQKLGYPRALLREWKRGINPPGIKYGVNGFRFSVSGLEEKLKAQLDRVAYETAYAK